MVEALHIEYPVHFGNGRTMNKELRVGAAPLAAQPMPAGKVPRVARMLALAHHLNELLRAGQVESYAELAELGHVCRPRVTQVMTLLNLAPDIQEEVLFLPRTEQGRDPILERQLRKIARVIDWRKQLKRWRELLQELHWRTNRSINYTKQANGIDSVPTRSRCPCMNWP